MEESKRQAEILESLTVKQLDRIAEPRSERSRSRWKERRAKNRLRLRSAIIAGDIMEALREKGMSRKDLAEKLNVTPACITRYLSGEANFQLETLVEIENVLGISIFKDSRCPPQPVKVLIEVGAPRSYTPPRFDVREEREFGVPAAQLESRFMSMAVI